MATTDQPAHEAEQDEEEFLEQDDIFVEIDQGDEPMDEDDDAGGIEGEVVWEDNSIQHFSGHEGPVYTVSAHPTTPLAVSGGGDDAGYIWDVTDGEIIVKLTGHTDSVSAVGFSSDGDMVSTGGMDGKVRVWRRVGKEDYKTWEFLTELQGPDEVIVRSPAILCFASTETNCRDYVCSGCVGTPKAQSWSLAQMTVQFGYGSVSIYHPQFAKPKGSKSRRSAIR
jgi:WD40 repeat protein